MFICSNYLRVVGVVPVCSLSAATLLPTAAALLPRIGGAPPTTPLRRSPRPTTSITPNFPPGLGERLVVPSPPLHPATTLFCCPPPFFFPASFLLFPTPPLSDVLPIPRTPFRARVASCTSSLLISPRGGVASLATRSLLSMELFAAGVGRDDVI